MQFGLSFLPDVSPKQKSAGDYFNEIIYLSEIADRHHFQYIKMTEHYLHPYGGYCPSPLNFLSFVAARTKHIRLMTGCILPVFHHPIQIAAETAMLDVLSGGRLDVGFARAYLPYEFDAFNISLDESRDRFNQTITTVKQLWTEENVSVNNSFFNFERANNLPRCVQAPHPPIWGAAVNARQSFVGLAEAGYNLLVTPPPGPMEQLVDKISLYHDTYAEVHGENKKGRIAISLPICVNIDEASAIKDSNLYLQNYLNTWADATSVWSNRQSTDYPGYSGLAEVIKNNSPQKMREHTQALVGVPAKIIDDIKKIERVLGVDTILLQIDFGGQPLSVAERTLQYFINDVLPGL